MSTDGSEPGLTPDASEVGHQDAVTHASKSDAQPAVPDITPATETAEKSLAERVGDEIRDTFKRHKEDPALKAEIKSYGSFEIITLNQHPVGDSETIAQPSAGNEEPELRDTFYGPRMTDPAKWIYHKTEKIPPHKNSLGRWATDEEANTHMEMGRDGELVYAKDTPDLYPPKKFAYSSATPEQKAEVDSALSGVMAEMQAGSART